MLQIILWSRAPMIDHDGTDVAQGEQGSLLHGLLIRTEMLRGQNVPINQGLVGVHAVEDNHSATLVENRQVTDET